ncbi:hypothetical protein F0562_004699 [Nyssa sinensis]|uniref:Uncharacterized protein n=1 Tax=Nyssa sinensis TaxID=561372 RepID=A0A5J5C1N0_9ASTE|nr:hypothetical protein F0562_004699 [Nyssa sinensis]
MGSDSISNASISGFSNDLGKKKKTNRLAKLKQSKLDVRREQWLSQVKNKVKVDSITRGGSPPSSGDEGNRSIENLEMRSRGVDIERIHGSSSSSGSRCGSASSGCCSGSVSEAELDDGCLDDWEAVADALTLDENQHNANLEPPARLKIKMALADPELPKNCGVNAVKIQNKGMDSRTWANCQPWHPDDAFCPQSLPNVSRQHSLTMNSKRLCTDGDITWAWQSLVSQHSCPILLRDGRCPGCRKQYDLTNGDRRYLIPLSLAMKVVTFTMHKFGLKQRFSTGKRMPHFQQPLCTLTGEARKPGLQQECWRT